MRTYRAQVRVPAPSGSGRYTTHAEVRARDVHAAKQLLEAQYGRGNVLGTPVQCR